MENRAADITVAESRKNAHVRGLLCLYRILARSLLNSTTHTQSRSPPSVKPLEMPQRHTEMCFTRLTGGTHPIRLTVKTSPSSLNMQPRLTWNPHHPASASWVLGFTGMCYYTWLQVKDVSMKAMDSACLWMIISICLLCIIISYHKKNGGNVYKNSI